MNPCLSISTYNNSLKIVADLYLYRQMTRFLRLPLELLPLVVEQVPVVPRLFEPKHQVVNHPGDALLHSGRCHLAAHPGLEPARVDSDDVDAVLGQVEGEVLGEHV